jgi:hypothetical protein
METLRGNRKATTHLPVYRYGYISRLSGMNPQFMVSDHLSGIPTTQPCGVRGQGSWRPDLFDTVAFKTVCKNHQFLQP